MDGDDFDKWIQDYTPSTTKLYTQEFILPTSDKIKEREISEGGETKNYLFKGWALTTSQQTEIIDKIPANTDFDSGKIELFAHWDDACKITLNDFRPNESEDANKNLTIYIPKNQPLSYEYLYPTADSRKFTKWTKGDSDYDVDSLIVNDITLTANWVSGTTKKIEFKNSLSTENAPSNSDFTIPQPQYLLENDKVKEPKAPNVFGYKFLGWYLDDSTSNKFDFNTVPDDNLTLYAQWQLIDWNINYELNYGSWNNFQPTTNYNIKNRSYQLPKNDDSSTKLIKNHYTFDGWYKSSSFVDGSKVNELNSETGDLTLYAKWTLETGDDSSDYNSINFVSNGGDGFMPTQHVFENEKGVQKQK